MGKAEKAVGEDGVIVYKPLLGATAGEIANSWQLTGSSLSPGLGALDLGARTALRAPCSSYCLERHTQAGTAAEGGTEASVFRVRPDVRLGSSCLSVGFYHWPFPGPEGQSLIPAEGKSSLP